MRKIDHKFIVIGLAETNIRPENRYLFEIDNQETVHTKSKGSGVGLPQLT